MKVKNLIAALQAMDPTGEVEVCVGNEDIIEITSPMPGYWDGTFFKIHIDDAAKTENNVRGIKAVEMGAKFDKIKLQTLNMEEAFLENPDVEWIGGTYNPARERQWRTEVEVYRARGRVLRMEIDKLSVGLQNVLNEDQASVETVELNEDTTTISSDPTSTGSSSSNEGKTST